MSTPEPYTHMWLLNISWRSYSKALDALILWFLSMWTKRPCLSPGQNKVCICNRVSRCFCPYSAAKTLLQRQYCFVAPAMQVFIRHFPVSFAASSLTSFWPPPTHNSHSFFRSVCLIIVILLRFFSFPFSRPPPSHTHTHTLHSTSETNTVSETRIAARPSSH